MGTSHQGRPESLAYSCDRPLTSTFTLTWRAPPSVMTTRWSTDSRRGSRLPRCSWSTSYGCGSWVTVSIRFNPPRGTILIFPSPRHNRDLLPAAVGRLAPTGRREINAPTTPSADTAGPGHGLPQLLPHANSPSLQARSGKVYGHKEGIDMGRKEQGKASKASSQTTEARGGREEAGVEARGPDERLAEHLLPPVQRIEGACRYSIRTCGSNYHPLRRCLRHESGPRGLPVF